VDGAANIRRSLSFAIALGLLACNLETPVEVCEPGAATASTSDVELRQSWTGGNGSYTDHCDANGNLVEYGCDAQVVCSLPFSHVPPDIERTGEVVATAVDCNGSCSEGACRSSCPDVGDIVTYLEVDASAASFLNETKGERYDCALIFDNPRDSFDCSNDPRPGDAEVIAGLGLFGSFCTSKNFGNIGLESGCSYRCGTPEVEPLLPDSCPAKGDLLTYLDVGIGNVSVQNAGDGRIYACRRAGKCRSDPRPGDQAFVTRARLRDASCAAGELGILHWADIGRFDALLDGADPSWEEPRDKPGKRSRTQGQRKPRRKPRNRLVGRPCAYVCEIAEPEAALGAPEICKPGSLASRLGSLLDPGTANATVGVDASFTDRCDADGNLIEYRCETEVAACFFGGSGLSPVRPIETGGVVPEVLDCNGNCANGSCPARCPQYFDPLEFIAVGEDTTRFRNGADESLYDCEVIFDAANDEFDCATDPMVGDEAQIVSLGSTPFHCTSGTVGAFGVALPADPGQQVCGYQCELAN